LLCFHGYGEDAYSFSFLEKHLGETYTLIAIDFPFHGKTVWKDGLLFTADDLLNIIQLIHPSPQQKINILAYSMGGRVALHLLQIDPAKFDKIILVAPDGLHHNIWHWLSTQTLIGNKLFAFTMQRPTWLFALMKLFFKLGLFNKSIFNFVHYYLDHKHSRLLLYERWTTMRKFNPRLTFLKKVIQKNEADLNLLFGKYDRIILAKNGLAFQKNIEAFVTVKEIEVGHQLLKEKYAADITAMFGG
jgi:pimeloyl-ACP methyl ester carboxylesterase